MPPKKKPATVETEAQEDAGPDALGLDAYDLPRAVITRVAKSAIGDNTKLAKEVPQALIKASTVFVSYFAAMSQHVAAENSQKTIAAHHVMEAARLLNWSDAAQLSVILYDQLEGYREASDAKRAHAAQAAAAARKKSKAAAASEATRAGTDGQPLVPGDDTVLPNEQQDEADETNALDIDETFDAPDEEEEEDEEEDTAADELQDDVLPDLDAAQDSAMFAADPVDV
ncbi:uncharacterized protein L969DRAFT_96726 [Mixia osmundae IAM 14324]|uniref:DNA polymerase epsilon subunit D n=1 Tax=Mixia osmundae (strain CBS 9802 / IAM 14324 / JCM 22182 / KY 12970) TaxID=764103 RepID=G7DZI3_MIXOS|nr:uncharacterized protein L969DRAFT_96726 [Mixia osmundae IAM 14324]KEI37163.1 hypothetical protein L969DRAFT_96726 [Mixia osmundae IAM 14324]GAA95993.1 hypothetical protein E5Q_02651 [Mixia osmundae IAM 14324]